MMDNSLKTLRSLSGILLSEIEPGASPGALDRCGDFVTEFIGTMQPPYQIAVRLLVFWLQISSLTTYRRQFSVLCPAEKLRVIECWRKSRLSIRRDLIRLVLLLVVISFYDSEETTSRLGISRRSYLDILSVYNGVPSHG